MEKKLPHKRNLFDRWCHKTGASSRGGTFEILTERPDARDDVIEEIASVVRVNYENPVLFAERVRRLGYEQASNVIRLRLPTTSRARSGDLGEILATEYVNRALAFRVPINRLQWKDGRNMALRGDDIVGFRLAAGGKLSALLKGESKSRAALSNAALNEANEKLREYEGRPSPHSLMYLADRLHELQHDEWAEVLEDYALLGTSVPVTHLVFTLSGNSPEEDFSSAISAEYLAGISRQITGVIVSDHGTFVKTVFELANA